MDWRRGIGLSGYPNRDAATSESKIARCVYGKLIEIIIFQYTDVPRAGSMITIEYTGFLPHSIMIVETTSIVNITKMSQWNNHSKLTSCRSPVGLNPSCPICRMLLRHGNCNQAVANLIACSRVGLRSSVSGATERANCEAVCHLPGNRCGRESSHVLIVLINMNSRYQCSVICILIRIPQLHNVVDVYASSEPLTTMTWTTFLVSVPITYSASIQYRTGAKAGLNVLLTACHGFPFSQNIAVCPSLRRGP